MQEDDQAVGAENSPETGKAAVRRHLISRLDAAGLVRAKGVSERSHTEMCDRLVDHLAYLSADNLAVLAEVVMGHTTGAMHTVWPAEVTIRAWAAAIERPPMAEALIVSSWLASVEGPVAEAGGYLVELYRFLSRHRRPPLAMDARDIKRAAAEAQRSHGIIRDRIERGHGTDADRAELHRYAADLQSAQMVVDAGRARRVAKQNTEGQAA